MDLDIHQVINTEHAYEEGIFQLPAFGPGNYYWKVYRRPDLFDVNKKWCELSEEEQNILLFGSRTRGGERIDKKIEDMCEMEFRELREELLKITDPRGVTIVEQLVASLDRMIDIGLPYLSMNRESSTLSGGEAQRLKLVRYMGSSLTDMIYIFDEPSTGMHPRDVHRMSRLLKSLRDKGNTVLVVEHDKDIIRIADEVIDVGPLAGKNGGQILFQGSYKDLLIRGTRTGEAMKEVVSCKENPRKPTEWLPVKDACLHNLKHVDVDIPLGVLTVVTGVAGSGKSSLIRDVFAKQYADRVVLVDQSAVTATGRSTACTYLGFFDEIRKE